NARVLPARGGGQVGPPMRVVQHCGGQGANIGTNSVVLCRVLAGWVIGLGAFLVLSQVAAQVTTPAPAAAKPAGPQARNLPNRFAGRAGAYYKAVWGVDSLSVKWTESGEVIRFAWRVLDSERARVLNDKAIEPSLIDPQAGVSLVVPQMEKI